MKRVIIGILISGLLAGPAFAKKAPPAPLILPSEEVIAAERAFDAFTAEHGFNAGFHEFSAPDALTFGPAPERTHDTTAAAITAVTHTYIHIYIYTHKTHTYIHTYTWNTIQYIHMHTYLNTHTHV